MAETEFLALLWDLIAAFPNAQIGAETIRVYSRKLSDIPTEHLAEAMDQLAGTARFFPTIAEIREVAEAAWTRTNELQRASTLRLEEPRADPNDPRVIEAKAKLAQLGVKIPT